MKEELEISDELLDAMALMEDAEGHPIPYSARDVQPINARVVSMGQNQVTLRH